MVEVIRDIRTVTKKTLLGDRFRYAISIFCSLHFIFKMIYTDITERTNGIY